MKLKDKILKVLTEENLSLQNFPCVMSFFKVLFFYKEFFCLPCLVGSIPTQGNEILNICLKNSVNNREKYLIGG